MNFLKISLIFALLFSPLVGRYYCCVHEHFLEIHDEDGCACEHAHDGECACSQRLPLSCMTGEYSDFLPASGTFWLLMMLFTLLLTVFLPLISAFETRKRAEFHDFRETRFQFQAPVRLHLLKSVLLN